MSATFAAAARAASPAPGPGPERTCAPPATAGAGAGFSALLDAARAPDAGATPPQAAPERDSPEAEPCDTLPRGPKAAPAPGARRVAGARPAPPAAVPASAGETRAAATDLAAGRGAPAPDEVAAEEDPVAPLPDAPTAVAAEGGTAPAGHALLPESASARAQAVMQALAEGRTPSRAAAPAANAAAGAPGRQRIEPPDDVSTAVEPLAARGAARAGFALPDRSGAVAQGHPAAPREDAAMAARLPEAPQAMPGSAPAPAATAVRVDTVAATPAQVPIAEPVDSPAFAPALATQVRWLVDGEVQQARLTLNPADMGPVAVRIQLDGTQARIDFTADVAATRSAIESSLPMLAAALSDSGLTLAGGGVFDGRGAPGGRHAGAAPGEPSGQAGGQARGPAAGDALAQTVVARPARARGLVDLLA
ncbi:MAG TPA: flagellar hook-length control protein FliK [Burkholderiaceae bacterium]|nr:flagellar hook-length control protein FliK [Burkholderiaceae bacterium]